jgi:hypothetical protein
VSAQAPRRLALAGLALALAVGLAGCETTQERSARLRARAHHATIAQRGLTVTKQNPDVKVLSAMALHDRNGVAAVLELRNLSARALRDVPIAIAVSGAGGTVLYRNDAPGLDATLTSIPLLPAHGEATWIDDQIQAAGTPARVSARVGEAPAAGGATPALSVGAMHTSEDATNGLSAEGVVVNHSAVTQQNLVVYALARRAGRIVAAGRAVLPEALARRSTPFQVFFIGSPRGAKLQVSAPPSTLAG